MTSALNFGNIAIDQNGRVTFAGLASGIDYQKAVDSIIAAKKVPIDTLNKTITENEAKLAELNVLKTNLSALKDALSDLYGAISIDSSKNAFALKQTFASTSRADGATPSAAGNLLGVSVSNSAVVANHTLEILRTAKAHKVASDKFTSTTTTLGLTTGDTFTVNGKTITANAADTLQDIRDKINGANTGTTPSGVTASIVTVSATEHYLVLTKDATGASMTLADTGGSPLATLGVLTGGGAINHELQAAETARFYADGMLDQTDTIYESALQSASSTQIGSSGQLTFRRSSDNAVIGTINYNSTDTLEDLATAITAGVTGATATVVNDGAKVRLEISAATAFTFSETGAGSAIADLGLNNKRLAIERTSNTITDLFTGMTLTLNAAEQGTTIKVDVQTDLSSIKSKIVGFVDAYNAVKQYINQQNATDPTTGAKSDDAGPLFGSRILSSVQESLGRIIGKGADGVSTDFQVLSQIGIDFVDNDALTDPTLINTLEIDEATLDAKLLSNVEDIRRMFTLDFTSSDPRVRLLSFDGSTTYNGSGFTLNLQPNPGSNLLQYSEQANDAYWTATRATVNANAVAAPDGQTTADALVADTNNNTHLIANTAPETVTSGLSYVFSTYVKAGAADGVRIAMTGSFAVDAYADFNLSTGAAIGTGAGAEGSSIESVGNGWYRVSVRATATATGNATFERYSLSGGATSFAGDGATVSTYLWGSQLEEGAGSPGGYIQTTNSAETGVVASANVNGAAGGADDGSASVSNGQVTVLTGDSAGLILYTTGFTVPAATTFSYTVGLGAQMFFEIDAMLDEVTGNIASEVDNLTDQNELHETRVTEMTTRLDYQREQLLARFTAMEQAIARSQSILDSLKQQTDAMFQSR